MFISLKANKKRIIAFLVLVCVVVGACFLLQNKEAPVEPQEFYGGTNEERVMFLKSFGWEIDETAIETREVMIPETFNEVYTTYNDMQKAQGFDLKPYAGYKCMQYKYLVTNYPSENEVYATLLVYDKLILGGDLACAEVDGFMHGFAKDSAAYGEKAPKENNAGGNESSAPESSAGENAAESSALENAAESSAVSSGTEENNAAENNAANEEAENEKNTDAQVTDETAGETETAGEEATGEETAGEVTEEAYPTD